MLISLLTLIILMWEMIRSPHDEFNANNENGNHWIKVKQNEIVERRTRSGKAYGSFNINRNLSIANEVFDSQWLLKDNEPIILQNIQNFLKK